MSEALTQRFPSSTGDDDFLDALKRLRCYLE
jgi:hypothetical protein